MTGKEQYRGEYPPDWFIISTRVKEAADWKCVRCGHPHDPPVGRMLTVHHLDKNKSNCEWWNIPPLCQKCHLQIEHKVIMDRYWMFDHSSWFVPYVAGYYAFINGEFHFREYVDANLERLLELGKPNGLRKVGSHV